MAEMIAITHASHADILRARFVREARALVGVPYAHRGRDPVTGLDCFGVVYAAAVRAGFRVADYFYDLIPADDLLDSKLAEHMVRLARWQDAREGDVVTSCYRLGEPAKHCGVVVLHETDNLRCVHARRYQNVRRVVEGRWTEPEFNCAAFRPREIALLELD